MGTRYPDREVRQRIQNAAQGRVQSTLSSYLVLQKNLKVSSTLNTNGLRYSAYTRYPDRVQRQVSKIVGAALDQGIVCVHSPVSYATVV